MPRHGSDVWLPRWMFTLAVLFAGGWLLWMLRGVLTPLLFAFLIAYMLDPLVDRFEARGMPRSVGIGVLLTLVLGALVLIAVLVLPGVVRDMRLFFEELPATLDLYMHRLSAWLAGYGVRIPTSAATAFEQMELDSTKLADAIRPAGSVLTWLAGGTVSLFGAAVSILMIPVFAGYLLHDFDRITAGIADLVPPRWRDTVAEIAREADTVLGGFIRGQLLVMLVLAVLYSVAYAVLGVRLAVVIGLVAGLLSFIPYLGGAVALGLALIMLAFNWGGWPQLVAVVVAYTAIQMLEGFVITPRVVGDKVGLQPIWVLLALLIAGELFGFLGVLMALPAAAVLKVFIVRGIRYYRSSSAFGGDFAAGPGGHAEPAQEPVDPTQAREPTPPTGGRVDE